MFKAIGNLIYKTPWWGLILAGITTLGILVLFALPVHVIRLVDSGATPAENRAIQREIGLAVGSRALDLAKGVLGAMQERTTDIERRREFARALGEIERAREELVHAQSGVNDRNLETARDAADSALESATEAAQSALEAASEARQAVEEAKNDALERLRDTGVDLAATLKSFEQLIASARENEQSARDSLFALRALQSEGNAERASSPPAPPAPAAVPKPPATAAVPAIPSIPAIPAPPAIPVPPGKPIQSASTPGSSVTIGIPLPGGRSSLVLSPEARGDIHTKVGGDVWRVAVGSALILAFIPLFVMLLIAKFFIGRSRNALALADRKTREAEISDVSRQVTEARLQALQAQVEPHFLYNTLANVQALNEVDPPAANQMVGHLIQYLRASLPKMRESTSTVGQELELVRAYLNILQMRMGARLVFEISAPDDVLAYAFPPMMLPSLVENAIKHGLEPQREGGRIDVVVERLLESNGETLRIQVKDTGKGLSDTPVQTGGGVGLTNLRERLAAIYGTRGRFTLTSNDPKGVVACIEVPLQSAAAYQQASLAERSAPSPTPAYAAATPATGWRKVWYATSKTHSIWARLLARTFMVLMVVLAGLLLVGFIGLLTGWMPVQMGDLQLDGVEGLAVGSVGLLIGFGAAALTVGVMVAVLYGMGFLVVGLLIFIAASILIGLFPLLSPFILIGLAIWWFAKRSRA
ncbi:MAG: histidine kinase [Burkholderiales bacterium]|nr:histidine kinase [Burkholderiales bacterium]